MNSCKVAFFLDNRKISRRSICNVEKGNPGMGATEYLFFSLVIALADRNNDVMLFLTEPQELKYNIMTLVVADVYEAVEKCVEMDINILVFRNCQERKLYSFISNKTELKCVVWAHNFNYPELEWVATCSSVKAYVCVSKAQMEELSRFPIYKKITYIYNFVWQEQIKDYSQDKRQGGIVCQGAITKDKGFHVLAKIWPDIKRQVPDAKLQVIGSGKLYSDDVVLGNYGIASEEYEKEFISYLLDEETGEVDKDITFWGVMPDQEMRGKIISESTVGVLNLTASSETLGMSGVEMQALGIPVVTAKKLGCRDVVKDKVTGYSVKNEQEAVKRIVELLTNDDQNRKFGMEAVKFVEERFAANRIFNEWEMMFRGIMNDNVMLNKKISFKYRVIKLIKGNRFYKCFTQLYLQIKRGK